MKETRILPVSQTLTMVAQPQHILTAFLGAQLQRLTGVDPSKQPSQLPGLAVGDLASPILREGHNESFDWGCRRSLSQKPSFDLFWS